MPRAVSIGVVVVFALLAAACSSAGTVEAATQEGLASATAASDPTSTAIATTAPVPAPTPTSTPSSVPEATIQPQAAPTEEPVSTDNGAFCTFMATRYFWEPNTAGEFLTLMPPLVPTSIVVPVRAMDILSAPGLGDARTNSQANMVLFTTFGSDLASYLQEECMGANWFQVTDAVTGDPDFNKLGDPLVPSSQLDLCASLVALDSALQVERESPDQPTRGDTVIAAQTFASAIDSDAPFEVLAFSHLLVTQAAISMNQTGLELYNGVAFDTDDLIDAEVVSAYFDTLCPSVSDTRSWLTPPRGAGALEAPAVRKGLPEGWETVPAEDVRSPFAGDLRTLPVREATSLQLQYPNREVDGVTMMFLSAWWLTASVDPPEAKLSLTWIFPDEELVVELSRFVLQGPDGTRYFPTEAQSLIEPGIVDLGFELDVIPENLNGWAFGIFPTPS